MEDEDDVEEDEDEDDNAEDEVEDDKVEDVRMMRLRRRKMMMLRRMMERLIMLRKMRWTMVMLRKMRWTRMMLKMMMPRLRHAPRFVRACAVDMHIRAILCRYLQVKCRSPRPRHMLCASRRSRNAHGHVARAVLGRDLQKKCRPQRRDERFVRA